MEYEHDNINSYLEKLIIYCGERDSEEMAQMRVESDGEYIGLMFI